MSPTIVIPEARSNAGQKGQILLRPGSKRLPARFALHPLHNLDRNGDDDGTGATDIRPRACNSGTGRRHKVLP
jgi:hypothetical protein